MNHIFQLCLSLLVISSLLFSQDNDKHNISGNSEYIIGFNYSKLYSITNTGNYGVIFGANKIKNLGQKWDFKYGFLISTKQSKQKNQSIGFADHMANDFKISWEDFNFRFLFFNLNCRIDRTIWTSDKFDFFTILAGGYNLYTSYFITRTVDNTIEFEEYTQYVRHTDYISGDREPAPIPLVDNLENSGFSVSVGLGIKNQKYSLNAIYERDLFDIPHINNLYWGEKYHQLNIVLGIFIN